LLLLRPLLLLSPHLLSVDTRNLNKRHLLGKQLRDLRVPFSSTMIDDNTPYKLREIIMDTYPQLFWLKKEKEKTNGRKHTNTTETKGVV